MDSLTAHRVSASNGENGTQVAKLIGRRSERELVVLGRQEIPVRNVVGIEAHSAVHVHHRVGYAVAGVGGPELRSAYFGGSR